MRDVLLLNNGGEVLSVVSWKRALGLECRGRVRICDYHDVEVRTCSASFKLPSIIMLVDYVRIPFEKRVAINKRNLLLRDNRTCQYCGKKLTYGSATIDHVIPLSRDGQTMWRNVVLACKKCNNQKDNRTPKEARMKLRRKPFTPTREIFFLRYILKPEYQGWKPYFTTSIRSH